MKTMRLTKKTKNTCKTIQTLTCLSSYNYLLYFVFLFKAKNLNMLSKRSKSFVINPTVTESLDVPLQRLIKGSSYSNKLLQNKETRSIKYIVGHSDNQVLRLR